MRKLFLMVYLSAAVVHCYSQDTVSNSTRPLAEKKDTIIQSGDQIELFSSLDSINYFFGISLGHSVKGATFKLDPALVAVGLYQALEGTATYSKQQSQMIVQEINQRLMDEKLDNAVSIPDENLIAGKEFLAENAKREEVQTTLSGLQYEILMEGSGPKPIATDSVEVHYEGMFIDGEIFDSSYERGNPMIFPLPMVIAGWREGLQLMPVGSTFKLYIPHNLAYGNRRTGPIPPYSTLVFRITLLGIH
jgi:FKBP-type peptidyl-prolyl cis-trans isomerase FklB